MIEQGITPTQVETRYHVFGHGSFKTIPGYRIVVTREISEIVDSEGHHITIAQADLYKDLQISYDPTKLRGSRFTDRKLTAPLDTQKYDQLCLQDRWVQILV